MGRGKVKRRSEGKGCGKEKRRDAKRRRRTERDRQEQEGKPVVPVFSPPRACTQPRTVLSEAARLFINARPNAKNKRPKSAAARSAAALLGLSNLIKLKKSDLRNLCGPLAPRPELRSAPFWVHSKAKVFLLFYLTNPFFFARHPRSKNRRRFTI